MKWWQKCLRGTLLVVLLFFMAWNLSVVGFYMSLGLEFFQYGGQKFQAFKSTIFWLVMSYGSVALFTAVILDMFGKKNGRTASIESTTRSSNDS